MQFTTVMFDLKGHSDPTLSDSQYPSTLLFGTDPESHLSQMTDSTWTRSRLLLRKASVRLAKLDSTSVCLSTAELIS